MISVWLLIPAFIAGELVATIAMAILRGGDNSDDQSSGHNR